MNQVIKHSFGKRTSFIKGVLFFIFFSVACLIYLSAMQKKKEKEEELKKHYQQLSLEKEKLLEEQADLQLEMNSKEDPEWIKMTLMKEIGVVPEGQVKVYFKKEENKE